MPRPDEDAQPATRGDLRGLRRWVLVAGVWAVAATAIAVIALVDQQDDGSQEEEATSDLASQVGRVQRQLDRRLDSLESRVEDLPSSEDVSKLERRLQKVEEDSSTAADRVGRLREQVGDLEDRVDELEQGDGRRSPNQGGQESP